jgi:hypothetical protein
MHNGRTWIGVPGRMTSLVSDSFFLGQCRRPRAQVK